MASITYKKISYVAAQQFKESFFEPSPTVGYVYIGKHTPYANESNPDSLKDSTFDEKSVWNNMIAAKKITSNDVELVIPKVQWTGNTKYKQYDDRIALEELLTGNNSSNVKPMYVFTSQRNVYKCVSNNYSANSTVEPTGDYTSSNGNIATSDGYIWKYMFNVQPSSKFLADDWIPVPDSTSKLDYGVSNIDVIDGELTTIVITDQGKGYVENNVQVVSAFTSGCSILQLSNTDFVAANMSASGVGLAPATHIEAVYAGNNRIKLSTPTIASGGNNSTANQLALSTRIYIEGDGVGAEATVRVTQKSFFTINSITANADSVAVNGYVIISGANSTPANAYIYVNSTNHIVNVTVSNTGTYFVTPTVTANQGNAVFTVTVDPSTGYIRANTISFNAGAVGVNSYINFSGGGTSNTPANARVYVNTTNHIINITVSYGGLYTSIPTATVNTGNAVLTIETAIAGYVTDATVGTIGINYSRANALIFGTGIGATARCILPPKYGHAKNPAKELGANNVMVSMKIGEIDSTEGGFISSNTTFRQYGILVDPNKYGEANVVSATNANSVISQTTDITLVTGDSYILDELVYQGISVNNANSYGYIIDQTSNVIKVTGLIGRILTGVAVIGANSGGAGRLVVSYENPEFEPYSGDILYTENVTKITRVDGQAENIKLIVRF